MSHLLRAVDLNSGTMMKILKLIAISMLFITAISSGAMASTLDDEITRTKALVKRFQDAKLTTAITVSGYDLNSWLPWLNSTKQQQAGSGKRKTTITVPNDSERQQAVDAIKQFGLQALIDAENRRVAATKAGLPSLEDLGKPAVDPAETALISAGKLNLKTRGKVDAAEVSIAELVTEMATNKPKAVAAAKKFKPLDAVRNGVSLVDLIAKKKAERAQGKLATADEETLGYVTGKIRDVVAKVPVHVQTAEEKFGAELVKELQKAILAGTFPLKIKGATDADKAKNAVASMIGMFDKLGEMEAAIEQKRIDDEAAADDQDGLPLFEPSAKVE